MQQRGKIAPSAKGLDLTLSKSKLEHFLADNLLIRWISVIILGGLLFASYLLISRIVVYNSDDASILLEAQSMLHGNYLLQGWYMPTDNFLTIDIPLYALGLKLGFPLVALLRIVPSLLYTSVILCSGYLVSTLLPHEQRLWSWLALLGILAFPPLYMVQLLLVGPIHVGTLLFALIALIAYRHFLRGAGRKWFAFAVLQFLLLLAVVGDPFVLVFLVVPLLLTECTQMVLKRRISLQENAVFFASLCAIVISGAIHWALNIAGVHILLTDGFAFTSIRGMLSNLHQAILIVSFIFNADIFTASSFSLSRLSTLVNAVVVLALSIAVISVIVNQAKRALLRTETTPDTKIIQASIWSSLGTVAAFILSTLGGVLGRRYLYPLLFLSEPGTFPAIFKFMHKYVLRIAVVCVFIANALPFAFSLAQVPASVPSQIPLLAVLREHHLTQGLGSYWVAAIVTVQSEEQIVVRQVIPRANHLQPYLFLANEQWFDPANLRQANFIIYRESDDISTYYAASVRTFGKPDHQYHADGFIILAWDTPLLVHVQAGYSFN